MLDFCLSGSWSQRTISRLLRSTLNPRMKWLLPGHSQDDYEDEGEEEGNFVVACNLVSRSSVRILRLQNALLSMSMQWQHVSGAQMGYPKICVKGKTVSGDGLLFVPALPFLSKHYRALWRLLEQRSLLLFIHEYTRRAHLTAVYISKLGRLLEDLLRKSHISSNPEGRTKVQLVSLCREFRIHVNHWPCLYAKVQSDHYLRHALAQQKKLLDEIRRTLDLLSLQVLVLMGRYVQAVLDAMGQSDLDHVPREVMTDILACIDLYNTALEEQRAQHNTTHLGTQVFQQICCTPLTNSQRHQPAAVSVKDLLSILAAHHANTAANQLQLCTAQQCVCQSPTKQDISARLLSSFPPTLTWQQLGLGATLKDKYDTVMMSLTAEYFLQLTQPLLSSLSYCSLRFSPTRLAFHRWTVSLTLATVQMSTVWVMSKAYQFLSSWSLNKFLLITQGDLEVTEKPSNRLHFLVTHGRWGCLIAFSSLVLKTFSNDCKRMSADLFERYMPSGGHWRLNPSPSEYASRAAQNVIGQVLDGVALLSDKVRIQALSLTMTAFMEAWMEHILKQRIKFSVQGALQLKQDFDSIRELICSDQYGLPEELLQQLLSLRVFQQVDSAVLCLLQQPQVRPYLQSRAWESFIRCCESCTVKSIDEEITSNVQVYTRTRTWRGISQPRGCSIALGASQQDWLDLRIHTSSHRWRLPGLQCLSKSEP
uniref:Coiled-coil protein 142 C-terminal domain-containing protein n=1 Tax=Hippocampus comes TaxID=109280 RepID=A0A3Q2Y1N9_HIPCM